MKLYTEEQVRKAINDSSLYSYINGNFEFKNSEDDIINSLTPIELPSNEEIETASLNYRDKSNDENINEDTMLINVNWYDKQDAFTEGVKYVIDKIKNQQ